MCDGEVSAGPSGVRLITRSDDGYYGSLRLAISLWSVRGAMMATLVACGAGERLWVGEG